MSLLHVTSDLFEAIRMSDFDVLEALLTSKTKKEQAIHDLHNFKEAKTGLTPLLLACSNTHNSDLVVLLYQHGVKLDQLGMHRETCLHLAARQAREDVLGKLLIMLNDTPDMKKILIDKRDDEGSTPLMCACFAGDIPCMRLLRENGAFLDQRNYRGQTPLMKAVCFRNQRVLDWLLTAQVDTLLRDKEDRQAVDYAKERGLSGMIEKICGKTITDEHDTWVDEKAEVTGAGSHLLEQARSYSSQPFQPSQASQQLSLASEVLEATHHQQEYQEYQDYQEYQEDSSLSQFESKYQAEGSNLYVADGESLTKDYSYTPTVDDTDPYEIYEQSKIDGAWQEFLDYENDCSYWYNNLTNESVYERPWSLGGPMETMDRNVANAKAAIFKGMLSKPTKAAVIEGKEGTEGQEGKEENSGEIDYQKQVKAVSAEVRKAAIKKVGKKIWKTMEWKERFETLQLDKQ